MFVNRRTQKQFDLIEKVVGSWMTIGIRIGMELGILNEMKNKRPKERLYEVFQHWLDSSPEAYPASWCGLNTLLEDCGQFEIAKQYFNFLDGIN